jgi:uncharacterized membrane protein (UPF0127 family)
MRRFARLEWFEVDGIRVYVARGARARLLGLALVRAIPPDVALLLPRCRSVHTFGMRFALDLIFLDAEGRTVRRVTGVKPGRLVTCRHAVAVVELKAGRDGRMPDMANEQNRLANALNPRVPIYRDAYNEYFVFLLSALGASVIAPVIFYIVMAFTDLWGLLVFAGACVLLELVMIFGLARPQMKPQERVGWALLWGFTAAALGLAFYELVAKPTL